MPLRPTLALLLFAATSAAHAANPPITVGPSPCTHDNLVAALSTARQRPGPDRIVVTEILVNHTVVIEDAEELRLEGALGKCSGTETGDAAEIRGFGPTTQPIGAVLTLAGAGNVTLANLYIDAGYGNAAPGGRRGGGIVRTGSGDLTLRNVLVYGNEADVGGALHIGGAGALDIEDVSITSNEGGVAVVVEQASHVRIVDSLISLNRHGNLQVSDVDTLELQDVTLSHAAGAGTAAPGASLQLADVGDAVLSDVLLRANPGGAVSVRGDSLVRLVDSVVEANGADPAHSPAAITLHDAARLQLDGTRVIDNRGGGLHLRDTSRAVLAVTTIAQNASPRGGGGVFLDGTPDAAPTLVLQPGVSIVHNRAVPDGQGRIGSGGGLRVLHGIVDGADAEDWLIAGNEAGDEGGGIHQAGGRVVLGSSVAGAGVHGNRAVHLGGGVLVREGRFEMFGNGHAAGIVGNATLSGYNGGGVYLEGGDFFGHGVAIDGNVGAIGGGVAMADLPDRGSVFCLARVGAGRGCAEFGGAPPAQARPCPGCNSISGNEATYVAGGAALARIALTRAPLPMRVEGAVVRDNRGVSLLLSTPASPTLAAPPAGAIELRDSLIAGNTVTDGLVQGIPVGLGFPDALRAAIGTVEIDGSTIAQNVIGADAMFSSRTDLAIHHAIVHQPGVALHEGNASGLTASHTLLHSTVGVAFDPTVVQGDPRLEARDGLLVPAADSPAIDFAPATADARDLVGTPRSADLPAANRFGTRDLGAVERRGDVLFSDGFED